MNRSRRPCGNPCKTVVYGDGGNRTRAPFPPGFLPDNPKVCRGLA